MFLNYTVNHHNISTDVIHEYEHLHDLPLLFKLHLHHLFNKQTKIHLFFNVNATILNCLFEYGFKLHISLFYCL